MKNIYHFEAMTTPCELVMFSKDKTSSDSVAKLILQETKRLEKKYNFFDPLSYLSQINQRKVLELDDETKWILKSCISYYNKTNKIFDITVGTIKDIYKNSKSLDEVDTKKESLKEFLGCEHIKITKSKISFTNPYTKIDLGGYVKEYAVDRAVKILKRKKIFSALINFGGDIYALGTKDKKEPFKIGIKDPKNPNIMATFVELENQAITTSASYERGYEIAGKRFSHILSGESYEQRYQSVSVISKSCVQSGIFSTAMMIDPDIKLNDKVIFL